MWACCAELNVRLCMKTCTPVASPRSSQSINASCCLTWCVLVSGQGVKVSVGRLRTAKSSCQNTRAQRNMHSKTSRCLCMNEHSVCHLHTHLCHINSVCSRRSAEADDLNWVSAMWVLCKRLPEGALSPNC